MSSNTQGNELWFCHEVRRTALHYLYRAVNSSCAVPCRDAPAHGAPLLCHLWLTYRSPSQVPTAHCASCNSDFVERVRPASRASSSAAYSVYSTQIENAGNQDDPREFMEFPGGVPGDMDAFGGLLNLLMRGSPAPGQPAAARPLGGGGGGVRFEMRTGGAGDRGRTYVFGGHNTLGRDDHQPPLAECVQARVRDSAC